MQISEAARADILYRCRRAAALTDGGYTDLSLRLHCLHSNCSWGGWGGGVWVGGGGDNSAASKGNPTAPKIMKE